MGTYQEFLEAKHIAAAPCGFEPGELHPKLFEFQRDIVRWALRRGRAALFEDCGLGKTPQQLEWARQVCEHTGGDVLILAPLAVSGQTKREGEKFGIEVTLAKEQSDVRPGINVTNYERLHKFDTGHFSGVVLDESSILKAYMGKTKQQIIACFRDTKYKLACTATPAPNDHMELGNHAEFLGVMRSSEMLSAFFINDAAHVGRYRVKGHAQDEFWRWMASWAVMIRKPSDLGYEDDGFTLPPLTIHQHVVKADHREVGLLFPLPASTMDERRKARRFSIGNRVGLVAEIVATKPDEPWLVWCDLNSESENLTASIDDAIEVRGSQSDEAKEDGLLGFATGKYRVLVTKPTIGGFGMNYQHCPNMIFTGLSDSYEQFYQATRRCWRFGQGRPVNVHVVTSELEGAVVSNIKRKEAQALEMASGMVEHMAYISRGEVRAASGFVQRYTPTETTQLPCFIQQ